MVQIGKLFANASTDKTTGSKDDDAHALTYHTAPILAG